MKDIILFDIDLTLFDRHRYWSLFVKEICDQCKVEEEDITGVLKEYYSQLESSTDYNPQEFLKLIAERFDSNHKDVIRILEKEEIYRESVYQDTRPVLEYLNSQGFNLGVLSEGLDFFQNYKLNHTGLLQHFNKDLIYISRRKLATETIELLPQNSIIVDDRIDVVKTLDATQKFRTIWLNRNNHPEEYEGEQVSSLLGLYKLL